MLGALTTFNAYVLALSRVPYAMALKGYLPKIFAKENSRAAPWVCILACSFFWALATILSFETTVMYRRKCCLTGLSNFWCEFCAALVALRIKDSRTAAGSFRVRGGLVGAILLGVPPAILIVVGCVRNYAERVGRVNALAVGLFLIALGVVFWFIGERHAECFTPDLPAAMTLSTKLPAP